MPTGFFRIPMGWGDQHSVLVDYGSERLEIAEDRYCEKGYLPRFDGEAHLKNKPRSAERGSVSSIWGRD